MISKGKDSKEKKENWFNRKIVAEIKPYFMQYIYPSEKTKMDEYINGCHEKCVMKFRMPLKDLIAKKDRTDAQERFMENYYRMIPMGMAPCTINRICWAVEKEFDNWKFPETDEFDYSILKCDDIEYSNRLFYKVKGIYEDYRKNLSSYMQYAKTERIHSYDRQMQKFILKEDFKRQCLEQCPSEEYLCNIVLDLCYSNSKKSKQFAWDICGDVFIHNLLKRNNYKVSIPVADKDGDIEFNGQTFSMQEVKIKGQDEEEDDTDCQ